MAESLPSFSSQRRKPLRNLRWKKTEYQRMSGIGITATSVMEAFMDSIKLMLMTRRIVIRIRSVICSEMKRRVVSISLVQRWMISPV